VTAESALGSVTIFALVALAVLAASLLIGGLLRHLWAQHEQRTIEKGWQERERRLDSRTPGTPSHGIFESRPAGTRDVAQAETVARVLYIVARDQPELFAFLREDFAAEEAEEVIEILMDRRQGAQPCEADRRDPHRKEGASVDLREMGFVCPSAGRETITSPSAHAGPRSHVDLLSWEDSGVILQEPLLAAACRVPPCIPRGSVQHSECCSCHQGCGAREPTHPRGLRT